MKGWARGRGVYQTFSDAAEEARRMMAICITIRAIVRPHGTMWAVWWQSTSIPYDGPVRPTKA